ncbi:MAG: sigma-70 family RNA polymerase sigma factor [FCB group bacterium]|nr:sigma-70 family RNA polymerase sigma factor [FCB group bacterium]
MTAGNKKNLKALVAGCREGNESDWTELVNRMAPVIFSICYRNRLSQEESFDVFGKVSLLVLKNLAGLREEAKILAYVATITRREAVEIRRRTRSLVTMSGIGESEHPAPPDGIDTIPPLEQEEDLEMMALALAGLSQKCRSLLTMLFLEPKVFTYREISLRTGIPVSSIGPTRQRCLDKLRTKMIDRGYLE